MWNARILAVTGIILAAASMRLLPHPPNFVPIAAICLFGGAMLSQRYLAFAIPLAAMIISDVAMALLYYGLDGLWTRPFVYGSFALIVLLGRFVRRNMTPLRIGGSALTGSVIFFVITNFGVWLRGTLYPLTWDGLAACYVAAIPFYRNAVAADLLYSAAFFGAFALAQRYLPALREQRGGQREGMVNG